MPLGAVGWVRKWDPDPSHGKWQILGEMGQHNVKYRENTAPVP